MTTKERKQYAKDKPSDLSNVTLGNKHLNFNFKQSVFTYKGHESTQFDCTCELTPGNYYFVTDNNCESHLIRNLMRFVRGCNIEKTEYALLFQDQKKNYWIVKPTITFKYDYKLKLELSGRYIGADLNKKIVIQEEISYIVE